MPSAVAAADQAVVISPFGEWIKTPASEVDDVTVGGDGRLWLAGGRDGLIWFSTDQGQTFTRIEASGFSRVSAGPDGTLWGVGRNKSLWKYAKGAWTQTPASDMLDVSAGRDGTVWLAGHNGTVWYTKDGGKSFTQIEGDDVSRISAEPGGALWAVKTDGSVWSWDGARWNQSKASGIGDIAASEETIWLAGHNGTLWALMGPQVPGGPAAESVAVSKGHAWVVGRDGSLWKLVWPVLN